MKKLETLPRNILSRITDAQNVLAADEAVVFAYLFGGLATGRVQPLSDVDIAVYVNVAHLDELAVYKLALFEKLADALGTAEVDLILLNAAPVSLAGRVLQNKQVLVDKEPGRRHAYESLTLREFFDFRILEEAYFNRRYQRGR